MYVILLFALFFISATLAGLFAPPFEEGKEEAKNPDAYLCCNTGDGANCKVDPTVEPVMYKGKKYGLLKF